MSTGEHAGRLGRKASLPRGRAVLGGLLVALSAVGLLMAHNAATRTDDSRWLVATSDIALGERIEAGDLGLAPMQLAETTRRRAFRDGDDVVGRTATATIEAGDLIQRSDIGRTEPASGPARRLTVALPTANALGGDIGPGDRVTILAADSEGAVVVAQHAMVRAVSSPRSGLGSDDELEVTVVVADEATAAAVLAAAARDAVALIGAAEFPG